jgi:hypothetical protein
MHRFNMAEAQPRALAKRVNAAICSKRQSVVDTQRHSHHADALKRSDERVPVPIAYIPMAKAARIICPQV